MIDKKNWGEVYLNHYEKCFGDFTAREVFTPHQPGPVIQILSYDNVIRGCRVYASLGLTHYAREVGAVGESLVCTAPCDDWPHILASALFYLVGTQIELGWGMVVGGINVIAPDFVERYEKSALYFSLPMLFPDHVRHVRRAQTVGQLYLATPITRTEYDYFKARGAVAFEKRLASSGVDTLELDRPSAV